MDSFGGLAPSDGAMAALDILSNTMAFRPSTAIATDVFKRFRIKFHQKFAQTRVVTWL